MDIGLQVRDRHDRLRSDQDLGHLITVAQE